MPSAQTADQLTRSLLGAASATVSSRHQGPKPDTSDPLERLVASQGTSNRAASGIWAHQQTPSSVSPPGSINFSPRMTAPTQGVSWGGVTAVPAGQQTAPLPPVAAPAPPVAHQRVPYQTRCNKCPWVSDITYDGSAFVGLVALLELHYKTDHGSEPAASQLGVRAEKEE